MVHGMHHFSPSPPSSKLTNRFQSSSRRTSPSRHKPQQTYMGIVSNDCSTGPYIMVQIMVRVYIYTCLYVCVYIYIFIYIYILTNIYVYIYIYTYLSFPHFGNSDIGQLPYPEDQATARTMIALGAQPEANVAR